MKKSKHKAVNAPARCPTRLATKDKATESAITKTRSRLPNEIIHAILDHLKATKRFKTLTRVARCNKHMYDIVIPKLYEVVIISEKNKIKLGYGHGTPDAERSPVNEGSVPVDASSMPAIPSRKDIATGYTRKLIINTRLHTVVPRSYSGVEEVHFGPDSLAKWPGDVKGPPSCDTLIMMSLTNMLPAELPTVPFHVTMVGGRLTDYKWIVTLLVELDMPLPASFEWLNVYLHQQQDLHVYIADNRNTLCLAYVLGVVVQYRDEGLSRSQAVLSLAVQVENCFKYGEPLTSSRHVCLMDLPKLLLSARERKTSDDVNKATKIKLFKCISSWPKGLEDTEESKWKFFDTMVKLVEPGFRPTMADRLAYPQLPSKSSIYVANARLISRCKRATISERGYPPVTVF